MMARETLDPDDVEATVDDGDDDEQNLLLELFTKLDPFNNTCQQNHLRGSQGNFL